MYAAQDKVLDSHPNRQINYVPGTGGQTPGVIHAHGVVAKVENDGVPAFTLTGNAGVAGSRFAEVTMDLPDVSNPPSLLLYHDHAYGFTRLNVYAGAAGAFLVSAGATIQLQNPPWLRFVGTLCGSIMVFTVCCNSGQHCKF